MSSCKRTTKETLKTEWHQVLCNISNRLLGGIDFVWDDAKTKKLSRWTHRLLIIRGFYVARFEYCNLWPWRYSKATRESSDIRDVWLLSGWRHRSKTDFRGLPGSAGVMMTGCVLMTDLQGGYLMHDGGGKVFINTVWICQAGGTDGAIRHSEGEIKQVIWFCRKAEKGYGCQVEATFAGWSGKKKWVLCRHFRRYQP